MASNFLGNINLGQQELNLPIPELVFVMLHEANHSKQLLRNFFDIRHFSKKGQCLLELEATLQACYDMGLMGYTPADFMKWELNCWLIKKYGIDIKEFIKQTNKIAKWAAKDKQALQRRQQAHG